MLLYIFVKNLNDIATYTLRHYWRPNFDMLYILSFPAGEIWIFLEHIFILCVL